ncbi:putative bifunctional diguanylate cyclase/phosphodiesterase [Actimicrobium antarcticum]|uniref:Bifunctional diguanylate cyclase/phosphodiesterase n=1 Tax=Actimicrobium antarcticum TaxID=1051899 RepID=A0ABP7SRA4_9BURK
MRFRSLESRIVVLFLLLILAVQLIGFMVIRTGINQNARSEIGKELVIGERVFRRLLDQNAHNLATGARVLALDYGFRQAIGTNDNETIVSVLDNHGARIGANLTVLIGTDRQIKSSMTGAVGKTLQQAAVSLIDAAEETGSGAGIRLVDGHLYQVVVVPVKAPQTIGWVAMAFPIDQRLVSDMLELSSLQVSALTRTRTASWITEATTLGKSNADSLASQLQLQQLPLASTSQAPLDIGGSQYGYRTLVLADDGEHVAMVVLLRSLNEAIAPYEALQTTLLMLTAFGALVAVAGSVITAKRITKPLRQLTDTARRLGEGDYASGVDIRGDDEISKLARAFDSMRGEISRREAETLRLAYWDTLTDLPNRAQLVKTLVSDIDQASKSGGCCHILMMNLDRFKNVNDVLGSQVGDTLLRQVAERLQQQLEGSTDVLARLGGDEFVVLLPQASLRATQLVADRILKSMERPFVIDDQAIDTSVGIGIAGFPEHGKDAASLLSAAGIAMYAAKKSGHDAVVYDPASDRASDQNLSLLSELRQAVERNEFVLYVQPKIALSSTTVIGMEALIRWVHPERGMIFPDNFIPFAEKTGFIRVMTRWVLEQSAALCGQLLAQGIHLKMSVNLSTRDLLDQDLPNKFGDLLLRHDLTAASFCLEITESAIMDDPVRALQTLERLHAMQVELSIDDFGTGYSSLAYLKRLPVDELKIDKSFVMNMENDTDDAQIVRSTIDLGHNMGLRVVAEGIESVVVMKLLAEMGCDQGQGYFISRPMPAAKLADWISQWTPPALHAVQSAAIVEER